MQADQNFQGMYVSLASSTLCQRVVPETWDGEKPQAEPLDSIFSDTMISFPSELS